MQLAVWLSKNSVSAAEFARRSGIGQRQLIYKYRWGMQFPTPENLRRIRIATQGEVTADDFVDLVTSTKVIRLPPAGKPGRPPKSRACAVTKPPRKRARRKAKAPPLES